MLIRIVSMLTKLGQQNHEVRENPGRYDHLDSDSDSDSDNDNDNEVSLRPLFLVPALPG